VKTVAFFIF